ncbi:MAG TPA: sigma factor-like helix-turn-helix DNA-binding protein [Pseudorhizobium sp.]|nr:sigma factor-like helix-turn-helix DNA-binding protein [Pseudorhizobium sp.]
MTIAASAPLDLRREFLSLLPRLRRFALTLARSATQADEVVRAAYGCAIADSDCLSGEGPAAARLFALIRRTAADLNATSKSEPVQADDFQPSGERKTLVLSMPDGEASAFLLVDVENFSYLQAADILGITQELLASHVCDARRSFASTMAQTVQLRA